MTKPKSTLSQDIKKLSQDIISRGKNGVIVALLTMFVLSIFIFISDPLKYKYGWIGSAIAMAVTVLIGFIINTDSKRSLNYSKQASYGAIIIGTAWLASYAYFLIVREPLFNITYQGATKGSSFIAELQISPLVITTWFAVFYIISGVIAYVVGRHRKDIKGIKKEDLFR